MAVEAVSSVTQACNSEIERPADPLSLPPPAAPTPETTLQATLQATLIATLATTQEEIREKIQEAIQEAAREETPDSPAQAARKAAGKSAAATLPAPSQQYAPAVADEREARYDFNSSFAMYGLVLCGLARGGLIAPKLPHREFPRTLSTAGSSTSAPPALALLDWPRRSESGGWTRSNR